MATRPTPPSARGAALLLCMVFTAAVMVPITVLSLRTAGHVRHAQYASMQSAALAAAESALALARADLARGGNGSIGFSGDAGAPLPHFGESGVSPRALPGKPDVECFTVASARDGLTVVYAVARSGSVERCVEGVYRNAGGTPERISWREIPVRPREEIPNAAL